MSHVRFPVAYGNYILLDRLNSGGMAEVYCAKRIGVEEFQKLFAIKQILPDLAEDQHFTRMFINEAKLAAQLSHSNIVQIFELGRLQQQLYIVMELIVGHDLRNILRVAAKTKQSIPMAFACYVIARSAEGLDYAHRRKDLTGQAMGLVHRDINPQNILVSFEGEVKVTDFGIARAQSNIVETHAGVLKGKFSYMAPEQVRGKPFDRRADIFALGIVLYELLSGRKLFSGSSDLSIMDQVKEAAVPPIREHAPHVSKEIEDILNKCLSKNPEDRYQWGSELAEALHTGLIHERSIFGAQQARTFMHTLFEKEIENLSAKHQAYAKVTLENCVGDPAAYRTPIAPPQAETLRTEDLVASSDWAVPTSRVNAHMVESLASAPVKAHTPLPLPIEYTGSVIGTPDRDLSISASTLRSKGVFKHFTTVQLLAALVTVASLIFAGVVGYVLYGKQTPPHAEQPSEIHH